MQAGPLYRRPISASKTHVFSYFSALGSGGVLRLMACHKSIGSILFFLGGASYNGWPLGFPETLGQVTLWRAIGCLVAELPVKGVSVREQRLIFESGFQWVHEF